MNFNPFKKSDKPKASAEVFTFGDPVPSLDTREILDYTDAYLYQDYYEPPIAMTDLAKTMRSSPYHSSSIYLKRNILLSTYVPHKLLSRDQFSRWVFEYLVFGNSYIERVDNRLGSPIELRASMAKHTRRGEDDRYFYIQNWREKHEFKKGSIHHLLDPDLNQEIYGIPEYLSALNSAWLNEEATLFRRKYYLNGSHAGFILYMTDTAHQEGDIDALRTALKESKGPGNFRNLFMYAPGGKKDGIQLFPISQVAAKDEFFDIKNASRDDILAAHRVPPQIMGIIPTTSASFGPTEDAARVFNINELDHLRLMFKSLNDWVDQPVITFTPYDVATPLKA